jgi:hypothetical protein
MLAELLVFDAKPRANGNGSSSTPLPYGNGSSSTPLPYGNGSSSTPLPYGNGSSSTPLPYGNGSSSTPLPGGNGSSSTPLPGGNGSSSTPLPGGNGVRFDWRMLQGQNIPMPWMLSGGLDASNLGQAVRITGAHLLDVSSGVEEAPGIKSEQKIAAFLKAAHTL